MVGTGIRTDPVDTATDVSRHTETPRWIPAGRFCTGNLTNRTAGAVRLETQTARRVMSASRSSVERPPQTP